MQNRTQKDNNGNLCVCGLHKRSALANPLRGRTLSSSVKGAQPISSPEPEPCSFCQDESEASTVKDYNLSEGIKHIPEPKLQPDQKPPIIPFGNNFLKVVQDPVYMDSSTWNAILSIWAPNSEDYLSFASKNVIEIKLDREHSSACRSIGAKVKLFLKDYQAKYDSEKATSANRMTKTINLNSDKEASNICRMKDPLLQEINFALFDTLRLNLPQESSRDHHKLADAYSIVYEIPIRAGKTSPKKENRLSTNVSRNQNVNTICRQPVLRDPAIISLTSVQSKPASPYQRSDVPSSATFNSSGINSPYQMAGSFMSSRNIQPNVTTQSIANSAPLSKSLVMQQSLMQAIQPTPSSSSPSYPPSPIPTNSNFRSSQPSVDPQGPSNQENCVNAAVIQQRLYRQYILAAASTGNRELLLYEQRLQQTQQIKTIIPQSRSEASVSSEMANNRMKTCPYPPIRILNDGCNSVKKDLAESNTQLRNIGSNIPSVVVPKATEKSMRIDEKMCENLDVDKKIGEIDEDTSEEEFFDSINQLCNSFN